ncbi:MAG: GTPase Era [Bdellovibrionales bacterium]
MSETANKTPFRAGYVGLIGQPNAGKSTLLNAIVGEKVAIVTPKPQTTRSRVVGIHTSPTAQICFNDAPGLIRAQKGLNKFLQQELDDVVKESDALVAVLALDEGNLEKLLELATMVAEAKKPWMAVITKTDLPKVHRIAILREKLQSFGVKVVAISAEKCPKEMRELLIPELEQLLPQSPGPLFDPEMYTTHSQRDLVTELVREQCFLHLHEEIPFGMAVRLRDFDEQGPKIKIEADLIVTKNSHRGMVIGTAGQRLKHIGQDARREIEKMLQRPVYLGLHVVVRPKWNESPQWLKELGYGLHLA